MFMFALFAFFTVYWAIQAQRSIRKGAPWFITLIYGLLTLMNVGMIFALLRR